MKIYLDTVGCRLNQAEIEQFASQFHAAGHTLVPTPDHADLVVINTCAVTAAAASDSRQKIRQAARAGAARVVATGCWATMRPEEAAGMPIVSQVVQNADKDRLVPELLQIADWAPELESPQRMPVPGIRQRTRAFIKAQDGCDNYCTFCVTRLARGSGRSRPAGEILADIHGALDGIGKLDTQGGCHSGAREIVLTGVHLGSWGQDFSPPLHLRNLVQTILDAHDALRLRLSSLEPWDLDEQFFALWEDPRLCRHLHLPLQSGCAATLRRMARKTPPQAFADLVTAAREAIPDAAITTDVITGFPGESEAEFEESLAFVRAMLFAGGHVFTYSARPGTPAARLPGQVPDALRKQRSRRMRAVLAEAELAFQQRFIGQVLNVLWESTQPLPGNSWEMSGLTDNYFRVRSIYGHNLWNEITPVRLTGLDGETLRGQIFDACQVS